MVRAGLPMVPVLVISRAYLHMVLILKTVSLAPIWGERGSKNMRIEAAKFYMTRLRGHILSATFCWSEKVHVQTKFKVKKTHLLMGEATKLQCKGIHQQGWEGLKPSWQTIYVNAISWSDVFKSKK